MTYNFADKLHEGENGERWLDSFFAPHYTITKVPFSLQQLGIDRIFTGEDGMPFTVEYKNDVTASKTGNAFVELVSVDIAGKKGWVFTCEADYIIYRVVGGNIYRLKPSAILGQLPAWDKYRRRFIKNDGYHSVGILVPLYELEMIAAKVYRNEENR